MTNKEKLINGLSESKLLSTENPFKSFEIAESVLNTAKKEQLKIIEAEAYFHMAYACRVMSKYTLALEYAFIALQIFKIENSVEGIVKTSNIIGIVYFYYGDYSSANTYYMKALELLKETNAPNTESAVLNNLGELQRLSKQWEKANEYYFAALELALKEKLKNNASIIYSNIGEVYYNINDYDNALRYLEQSYELAKEGNNYLARGEIESKLGMVMYSTKEYDKASKFYKKALKNLNSVDNKYYLIEVLINMSILEEAKNEESLYHLNEALDIAVRLELHPKISHIFQQLAAYYEKIGNYKDALAYYKAYSMKEKEIEADSLATRLNIMALEINYDREKKESKFIRELNHKFKNEIEKSHEELDMIKKENQQLLNENSIDELTQVYNRRGIRQLLLERTQMLEDELYAIYIIDIDYFKKYNDCMGHMQGDVCLAMIAGHLKKLNYKDYFIGRFGGEEFLCYVRVNNIEEAKEIAETIRKTVADLELTYKSSNEFTTVTVSVGGKVSKPSNNDMNVLIREADKALYKAKALGRNRIFVT